MYSTDISPHWKTPLPPVNPCSPSSPAQCSWWCANRHCRLRWFCFKPTNMYVRSTGEIPDCTSKIITQPHGSPSQSSPSGYQVKRPTTQARLPGPRSQYVLRKVSRLKHFPRPNTRRWMSGVAQNSRRQSIPLLVQAARPQQESAGSPTLGPQVIAVSSRGFFFSWAIVWLARCRVPSCPMERYRARERAVVEYM